MRTSSSSHLGWFRGERKRESLRRLQRIFSCFRKGCWKRLRTSSLSQHLQPLIFFLIWLLGCWLCEWSMLDWWRVWLPNQIDIHRLGVEIRWGKYQSSIGWEVNETYKYCSMCWPFKQIERRVPWSFLAWTRFSPSFTLIKSALHPITNREYVKLGWSDFDFCNWSIQNIKLWEQSSWERSMAIEITIYEDQINREEGEELHLILLIPLHQIKNSWSKERIIWVIQGPDVNSWGRFSFIIFWREKEVIRQWEKTDVVLLSRGTGRKVRRKKRERRRERIDLVLFCFSQKEESSAVFPTPLSPTTRMAPSDFPNTILD